MIQLLNYIKFQELLKQNIGKKVELKLKTKFSRDKDFSSYQFMFKELDVKGEIINLTPYHLLLKLDSKYNDEYRHVRYLDIDFYNLLQ